jgi:4-aminobutyrate aminotransferase/(S)-3-amino-2-methylpropionate transaminase
MFGIEHAGVEPDLMTLAKGLAGGFPLAAVVGKAEIMDAPHPGGLGGTYAASPLGCVAGLAVLDVISKNALVRRAQQIGMLFNRRLSELQREHPLCIGEIRAERGAMVAVELVKDNNADQPNPELARTLVAAAARRGLLILPCGVRGNVIRFMPALTITDDLISEGLDILGACLVEAEE